MNKWRTWEADIQKQRYNFDRQWNVSLTDNERLLFIKIKSNSYWTITSFQALSLQCTYIIRMIPHPLQTESHLFIPTLEMKLRDIKFPEFTQFTIIESDYKSRCLIPRYVLTSKPYYLNINANCIIISISNIVSYNARMYERKKYNGGTIFKVILEDI